MRLLALVVVAGCAGRVAPANNTSRPIQIDLRVSGWRAEEVRDRLERILVADPGIGIGSRTMVHTHVVVDPCSIGFGIAGEDTLFGIRINGRVEDEDDIDECLRLVIPSAARLLSERLQRYREQP
jgi:hypothetical protein